MSKRLQVLLDEAELRDLRGVAQREGVPLSVWVRRVLREARRSQPKGEVDSKIKAVRSSLEHEFPVTDIDEMLAEIERGYNGVQAPD